MVCLRSFHTSGLPRIVGGAPTPNRQPPRNPRLTHRCLLAQSRRHSGLPLFPFPLLLNFVSVHPASCNVTNAMRSTRCSSDSRNASP